MLTLRFVPYHEIEYLSSARRIHKLLDVVKENKIVLLEGRLKKEEETDLIEITMENIDDKFKGIELAVINPEKGKNQNVFRKAKTRFRNALLGNRQGLTVIGPATVVSEIKKNPDKIELYTQDETKKKKKLKNKK
ncbi:DUF2073 domain-containing protein [Candidatus Woesearchaeota archaeon]|nr:DUF2073 domain-containing protein [Candidatus Woesearchaeota archaeon]